MKPQDATIPVYPDSDHGFVNFICQGNYFNLSSLNAFEKTFNSKGFAIKFVSEGTERYTINGQSFVVKAGNYLLLNGEKDAKVEIDNGKNVKGMCITLTDRFLSEVVAGLRAPDTPVSDDELASFFITDHFLENQYSSAHTLLGQQLQGINTEVLRQALSGGQINHELFFNLAEQVVLDQTHVFKQLQSIRSVKSATRRDLCRRVLIGKEYIDGHFTEALTIETIAKAAGMSEYHFFRLFKQTIGVSPYQYVFTCRMKLAGKMLQATYSVLDTAISCGFSDIHSFSKAFKKYYGVAPTGFVKGNLLV